MSRQCFYLSQYVDTAARYWYARNMEASKSADSANALQVARAARLRELIEPWSLRKLEVRTGIGRTALDQRLKGKTPLNMSDIEVLAPVIRMTPAELFADLLAVDPKNPLQETFP